MSNDDSKVLRFRFQGVEYQLDPSDITGKLERELWKSTEMSVQQIMTALVAGASFGLAAVVWMARRLAGETVRYDEVERYVDSLDGDDIDLELLGDEEVADSDPQL